MFENKKTKEQEIHYSRYIISWINGGGYEKYDFSEEFEDWLKRNNCTEDEIRDIREMAMCGKMELEYDARAYVNFQ